MNKLGILATLHTQPGKEAEVEAFLASAISLVQAETGTTNWYAFRIGAATFGIFDTFKDEEGRAAHVNGQVASTLFQRARELFITPPEIQTVEMIAEKAQATLGVAVKHD